MPPLESDAIAALLGPLQFQEPALVTEILRITGGEPLHVSLIVKDLRDRAISLKEIGTWPVGFERYVRTWLKQIESGEDGKKAHQVLGLITVSAGPLTYSDIHDLAPDVFGSAWEVRQAVQSIARFLAGDGTAKRGLIWNHSLTSNVFASWLSEHEKQAFAKRFMDFGGHWWNCGGARSSDYFSKYWVQHLMVAQHWQSAIKILCSFERKGDLFIQPWLNFQRGQTGSHEIYVRDINRAADHAKQQGDVVLAFQCVLIRSSIYALFGSYSPSLLANLVIYGNTRGRWALNVALDVLKHWAFLPEEIYEVLDLLCKKGAKFLLEDIINATELLWAYQKGKWLYRFNPYSSEAIPKLLDLARRQIIPNDKARCLAAILPSVDPSDLKKVVHEISEALTAVECGHCRFGLWLSLPNYVSKTALHLISEKVSWLKYREEPVNTDYVSDQDHGKFLENLNEGARTGFENFEMTPEQIICKGQLSASELDELLATIERLPTSQRISGLVFLSQIAPDPVKGALWKKCLQTVLTEVSETPSVPKTLSLIPQAILSPSWDEMAERFPSLRLEHFQSIIPLIPERLLDKTLYWIRGGQSDTAYGSQKTRASILSLLAERFEGIKRCQLLEEAEKIARINDSDGVIAFVKALLPYISTDAKSEVIEAYSKSLSVTKFSILAGALVYCDEPGREALWPKILDDYENIAETPTKTEALLLLINNVPAKFRDTLKKICCALPLNEGSCKCWFGLLDELNRQQQEQLFSFCMTTDDLDGMITVLNHLDRQPSPGITDPRWPDIISQLFRIQPVEEMVRKIGAVAEELPHSLIREQHIDILLSSLKSAEHHSADLSKLTCVLDYDQINRILESNIWNGSQTQGENKLLFTIEAAKNCPAVKVDWAALLDRIGENNIRNEDGVLTSIADIVPEELISRTFRVAMRSAEVRSGALHRMARRMKSEMVCEFIYEAKKENSRKRRRAIYGALLPRLCDRNVNKNLPLEIQEKICAEFIEDCSYSDGGEWSRSSFLSAINAVIPWFASMISKRQLDSICLFTLEAVECWP